MTGKTPDFSRSSWAGQATADFSDVDPRSLLDGAAAAAVMVGSTRSICRPVSTKCCSSRRARPIWRSRAYDYMTRRDADEGRSPFSKPGGGTQIGERLFGDVTMYSDPDEPAISHRPVPRRRRLEQRRVGVRQRPAGVADRLGAQWRAARARHAALLGRQGQASEPVPFIDNLIVAGDGPTLDEMIAQTERALLVTCFWYIRTVDPQTALETGLTRDGVFLVEHGKVVGAVNNFRWNMSPIAAFAQATQIGATGHGAAARARRVPAREGAARPGRALQHELAQRSDVD